MKFKIIIFLSWIFSSTMVTATGTIIKGQDSTWAGQSVIFKTYNDYITKEIEIIDTCHIDTNGTFSLNLEINYPVFIFADAGHYFLYLYAEPNKEYNIILPPWKGKTSAEKLNPFFNPMYVHMAIRNAPKDDLNYKIQSFDLLYEPYYQKYALKAALKEGFSELDSAISDLTKPFSGDTNTYLNDYVFYKTGMLRHLAFQHKSKAMSDLYFVKKPVLYWHPAYMELFNKVFDRYFYFFSRTQEGAELKNDIGELKSYTALSKTLRKDEAIPNDTLLDLVILKNLHDEFYRANYSRKAMLEILDSLIVYSPYPVHREIGKTIRNKVTRLMEGYAPPPFTLKDVNGKFHSLSDFKGKYVYLNFCTSYSYACLNEYVFLNEIYERQKERLIIITILTDEDPSGIPQFLKVYKYPWLFLHYGNQMEIMGEYDIRAYPTYYLIGPDGKLIMSPAPSPSEGFEGYLFKIMKDRGDL